MILSIGILALGVILGAIAVVLRRKLTTAWMISILVSALLIAAIGGVGTASAWNQLQTDRQNVHIALRYLEQGSVDEASYYLKKVSEDSFQSLSAEALLETLRGNDMLARFKLDALEGKAKSDEEKSICLKLGGLALDDYEARSTVIRILQNNLNLSEKKAYAADVKFVTESGYYLEGVEILPEEQAFTDQLRVQANQALRYGSYYQAIQSASQLVEERPSAENRLLLAECIAEAAYNGYYIDGNEFGLGQSEEGGGQVYLCAEEERAKMRTQIESLTLDAEALQTQIEVTLNEEEKQKLSEELGNISAKLQNLQESETYLFVRKAFSSIADLHSLEASVVRARLYYAMRDYEQAMETLVKASSNPFIRLVAQGDVKNALNALRKAYASDQTVGTETAEFKEAMSTLLSSVGNDMIGIVSSQLTSDFSGYIVTSQKKYGQDLFITDVDLSNYPEVVITLSGRDTVIEEIIAQKDVIVRDTQREVTFTVVIPEEDAIHMNVCCVVDESGSMDGSPIYDLKNALSGFIAALESNVNVGIVGFEDGYRLVAPVSGNHAAAAAAVSNLHASGGTNITAGIQGAMEALRDGYGRKSILLMTDGQSSIDMTVVEAAAAQGISINCIGFGGVNDELLQAIADATGGQYIRADSSSELINVYLSLVGMIGNEVQVKYTITEQETEEVVRYFFLRTVQSGTSIRISYRLPEVTLPVLHRVDSPFLNEENLDGYGSINFYLYGEDLSNVAEVQIGGQTATILDGRQDDYLPVEVPGDLDPGEQTVVLIDQDGNSATYEGAVFVGQPLYVYDFEIGQLRVSCSDASLLPDGTLVLGGWINISNIPGSSSSDETLDMSVAGLITLQTDFDEVDKQVGAGLGVITIDAAALEGFGVVSLNGNDSGYSDVLTNVVASGGFTFDYSAGRIHLVQK